MDWIRIESLNDPRVTEYRDQKDAWLRVQADARTGRHSTGMPDGLFMAEGELVIQSALRSHHRVRSILGTPHRLEALSDRVGGIPPQIPVYAARQELMDGITGFAIHRGLLASAQAASALDISDLLEHASTLLVLEDLTNHDNVGGIFRNVAALGGDKAAVLLSPRCCDPLYRKAIRVSMGHVLQVRYARSRDWPGDLQRISSAGFRLVALTPDSDAKSTFPGTGEPLAILLGAEGPGLSDLALARADIRTRIPMSDGVDSLNVSVVAAIALDRLARADQTTEPEGPSAV